MDAIVLNGPKKGLSGQMFNFADPPSGLNFADPPSFDSPFWSFPNVLPENEYASMLVNFMGTILRAPADGEMQPTVLEGEQYEQGSPGWLSNSVYVRYEPFLFVEREAQILTAEFSLPTNLWEGVPAPFNLTREEYQAELDQFFSDEWVALAYTYFNSVWGNFDLSVGALIADEDSTVWDWLPFDFDEDGNIVIDPEFLFDLPFSTYGPADGRRFWGFFNTGYKILSNAYGTSQSLGMFPDRPGPLEQFFSDLWSGIKKFFPGLILARTSFLQIVRLNIFQIADKIVESNNENAVKQTWEGFGGSWNALKNAVNDGSNVGTIGEPATAAALITAATPIILSIMKLLDMPTEDTSEVLDLINSVTGEECADYVDTITEFVASYGLDNFEGNALDEIFDVEFPDVPDECIDPVTAILEDTFPETFSANDDDQDDDDDDPDGDDEGAFSAKNLILPGALLFLALK